MDIARGKTLMLLLVLFASTRRNVVASPKGTSDSGLQITPQNGLNPERKTGFPAPPVPEANLAGSVPLVPGASQPVKIDVSDPGKTNGSSFYPVQSRSDVPLREQSGSSQTAREDVSRNVQGIDAVCSTGLRLAFDCALKRVVTFGIRDHLVAKYRLPMVPLDVCQSDALVDVERCLPDDFINTFPSDTLLEVVRRKKLTVGTIDLSVFPQLASDQANTSGFYPELVQAVVRELTVIVLQNPGLRQELVGDRQLDVSIIEQPFSKRTRDAKIAVARKWFYGELCEAKSNVGVHELQQVPVSSGGHHASSDESVLGKEGQPTSWQNGLLCRDSTLGGPACYLYGCWSPWEGIPKDIFIRVSYVRFSTPMNLIAAVHRGEVHMTDVGTIASAYLPERYNFLPLREVLEPSCTIGAWKSFFLSRDSASKRKRDMNGRSADRGRTTLTRPSASGNEANVGSSAFPKVARTRSDFQAYAPQGNRGKVMPEDVATEGRFSSVFTEPRYSDVSESWEVELNRIRRLFFKLYGVQAEGAYTTGSHPQEPVPSASIGSNHGRSSETEAAFEEKTLVKLHHVDHFTFSYLFPEDFRICNVRKLTDLVSLLSDGEPVGAFGYGLAGRGGRRRTLWGSRFHCSSHQVPVHRALGAGLRSKETGFRIESMSRRGALCDGQSVARRSLQEDGHPQVMEFLGPLVPLAAFFAKSRDPVCRGRRNRATAAVAKEPTAPSSAAESKGLSHVVAVGVLMTVLLDSWLFV